jgi:hypothetical protein
VIVRFVDIGGIADDHCLKFLFIIVACCMYTKIYIYIYNLHLTFASILACRTQCYIFIAAPYDIVITPVHIDVAIGSTFSATCTAKGDPAPTYSWFFKDQMIQTGQQLSITGSATTDDGVYTCVATNSLGIRARTWISNVICCCPQFLLCSVSCGER